MSLEKLESSSPDELADLVCAYRAELGWSQKDLADRAGCSRPTIARLEAGRIILSVTMNKVITALNEGIAEKEAREKVLPAATKKQPRQKKHIARAQPDDVNPQQGTDAGTQVTVQPTAKPVAQEPMEKDVAEEHVVEKDASLTSMTTLNGFGPVFSNPERVFDPAKKA